MGLVIRSASYDSRAMRDFRILYCTILTGQQRGINGIPSITRTHNTSNQDMQQQAPNGSDNEGKLAREAMELEEENNKRHEEETKEPAENEKLERESMEQTAEKEK